MTNEVALLRMLRTGEWEIDSKGRIWRLKMRHGRGVRNGGGYSLGSRTSSCRRRRAEYRHAQGYLMVAAMWSGRHVKAMAHRVVWAHLHGPPPPGLTINHKNGRKDDNRPENLELATYCEQRRHALDVLHVRRWRPLGSKHPKTHLTERDVRLIRAARARGERVIDLARRYEMQSRAVSAICRGRTWKHI